jgi:RND family efflux transporter MFP subunit
MNRSRQSRLVLIAAFSLTALLLGVLTGAWAVSYMSRQRLQDPEFLQQQLKRVSPDNGDSAGGPPPALVRVSLAARKTIQPHRSIVGRLTEVRKVTVAGEVTGKVVKMPVEVGTSVIGDETLLALVDDVWSRLAIRQNRERVNSFQAQLDFELHELTRLKQLAGRNAITRSELESKQAKVIELRANLAEYEAAVEEQNERIARSKIVAPFDGTVVAKHVELGGHVSEGTPIVDVVSRGQVDALLMVPESVVNRMRVDQELSIRIDALGEAFLGTVVSVTPYGPAASRTFPVRVRLDDLDGRLKIGMSVTALVPTGPETEALVVSKDAVLVRPDGSTVWVAIPQDDGSTAEVRPVPVSVSVRMPHEYAITPETDAGRELLTAGVSVVIEGAERLSPKQRVRVVRLSGESGEVTIAAPPRSARVSDPAEMIDRRSPEIRETFGQSSGSVGRPATAPQAPPRRQEG